MSTSYKLKTEFSEETDDMPTDGQFVRVWISNGKIWCDVLRWKGRRLSEWIEEDNSWQYCNPMIVGANDIRYFKKRGG